MSILREVWSYFTKTPPIELYKFSLGTSIWRYAATNPHDYTYKSEIYKAEYVLRTGLHFSNDPAKDVLTLTLPADNEIAQMFFAGTPEYEMQLSIYRGDFGAENLSTIWTGYVNGASHTFDESTYTCDLTCETIASRMDRRGLARNYQILCPHTLFDMNCQVSKTASSSFAQVYVDSSNSYVTLVGTFANNYFAGGQIIKENGQRRFIMSNTNNLIYLERPMGFSKGETVTMYPGCNKSWSDCTGKFNNGLNYGGFRWIPITNPFVTNIG